METRKKGNLQVKGGGVGSNLREFLPNGFCLHHGEDQVHKS